MKIFESRWDTLYYYPPLNTNNYHRICHWEGMSGRTTWKLFKTREEAEEWTMRKFGIKIKKV